MATSQESGTAPAVVDKDEMTIAGATRSPRGSDTLAKDEIVVTHKWWSDKVERRARRKLDARILPIIFVIYGLAFLDRSNIGNANTAGMATDLGFDDAQYQWLLTIFYIAYILFQFLLLGYLTRPSLWAGTCVFVWGLASTLQATAFNWSCLMAARVFLAVAEAGFGAGIALYLSLFYPRNEIGLRFAVFATASAVASAFGGALAYGIVQAKSSIESWRLLFIIEGIPTVLMGPIVLFFLPDSIETCKFLSEEEQKVLRARLQRLQPSTEDAIRGKKTVMSHFSGFFDSAGALAALKDPLPYIDALLFFVLNNGYSSIPVYLPQILRGQGFTSIKAQGYTAPPYLAAWIISLCVLWTSDRVQMRGPFAIALAALGAVGYILLATLQGNWARYGVTFMVTISLFTLVPVLYMWVVSNQPSTSRKGFALTIFSTIGQCGPILGTRIFPASDGPRYSKGMWISAGLLLFGVVLASAKMLILHIINLKREKMYPGSARSLRVGEKRIDEVEEENGEEEEKRMLDVAQRGTDSPFFRYTI